MKTKLVMASLCALLAAALIAPSAQALTRKIYVTPILGSQDFCRAAPDQIKWSYNFKAKIERKNAPLPKKVYITYTVIDTATGATIVKQKLALKPRKFFQVGVLTQYSAGQNLSVRVQASFKSPLTGKTYRSDSSLPDNAPTVEQMDAAALPTCAAPVAVG